MDDPYVYPGTRVLKNLYDARDADVLDAIERRHVIDRVADGVPVGDFDLDHMCAIHGHLFQDVYEWAGEIRTVSLAKGGHSFLPPDRIELGFANIHSRVTSQDYLQGQTSAEFAASAASIMSDVNYAHPFREGNGRTQLLYLEQLAEKAGHPIAIERLTRSEWIPASIESYDHEPEQMRLAIERVIIEPDDTVEQLHEWTPGQRPGLEPNE